MLYVLLHSLKIMVYVVHSVFLQFSQVFILESLERFFKLRMKHHKLWWLKFQVIKQITNDSYRGLIQMSEGLI